MKKGQGETLWRQLLYAEDGEGPGWRVMCSFIMIQGTLVKKKIENSFLFIKHTFIKIPHLSLLLTPSFPISFSFVNITKTVF